ncbi:MAG: DNA polymerase III subunit epsilon [Hyphomicrobiaceae bacterium]
MTPCYVVTDVEVDGPLPGQNSMLSFASVAIDANGDSVNDFEATLAPLHDCVADPDTMAWFRAHPAALAAATANPQPAADVMRQYVGWVRSLPGQPIFVSHPLAMDAPWIEYYLKRFAGIRLLKGPWAGERLFYHGCLCLRSYAAGKLGWPLWACETTNYEPAWLGHHLHTHRAIDDARGYARLLAYLTRL